MQIEDVVKHHLEDAQRRREGMERAQKQIDDEIIEKSGGKDCLVADWLPTGIQE